MKRNDGAPFAPAFTLVELILVMALLATLLALAAPSLSRSMRGRNLDQEAKRLVALTEYARSEAISQGIPMSVWIDPQGGRLGVEPKTGYLSAQKREKEFSLNPDVHFEMSASLAAQDHLQLVEFAPDGTADASSLDSVPLADRSKSVVSVAKTHDGWGYEVVKESQ